MPVVALGGAGAALAPEVARAARAPAARARRIPRSCRSIGAALSLVRAEVAPPRRRRRARRCALAREAERACVDAGAAPQTVRVETRFEARERPAARGRHRRRRARVRRRRAASRVDEPAQLRAAADALGPDRDGAASSSPRNDFYRVFCENGAGAVAVVDGLGSVALAENAKRVIADDAGALLATLARRRSTRAP